MNFKITANDKKSLYHKMLEVLMNVKKLNIKSIENGYIFVPADSLEQAMDSVDEKKNINNGCIEYSTRMYFVQKPVFSYSYHGTINNESSIKSRSA